MDEPVTDRASAPPEAEALTAKIPPLTRRLLSGGAWALAGKVLTAGAGVAISVLLTRLLPPTEVGAYFLALSLATVAGLIARAGLEKTVLQMVAESLGRDDPSRARGVVHRVFAVALITIGLTGLLIGLGGGRWLATELFSSASMARLDGLLGVWTAYLGLEILFAETFRGFHDIPRASLFGGAISRTLSALTFLTLLLWRGGAALDTVVLVTVVCGGASLLMAWAALGRKLSGLSGRQASSVPTASVLGATWPLMISNVTLFFMGQADLWILGAFRPDQEVAIYGVSVRLVLLVGVSLTIVNAVLPPMIGELYAEQKRERMERIIRTTASVAAAPSVVLLTAFIVFGGPILNLAFGSFYRDGALILALLSIGQLVNVWVGSCGYTLIMTGHQRELMWSALLSGSISVIGGLATVKSLGAVGVATSVALGTIVQQLLMLTLARKRCGVWTHASPALVIGPARQLIRSLRDARRGSHD